MGGIASAPDIGNVLLLVDFHCEWLAAIVVCLIAMSASTFLLRGSPGIDSAFASDGLVHLAIISLFGLAPTGPSMVGRRWPAGVFLEGDSGTTARHILPEAQRRKLNSPPQAPYKAPTPFVKMSVRHSAADLRGLKAKREREVYDGVVSGICSAISHQIIEAAIRGDSKFVAILKKTHKEHTVAMTYINSINGNENVGSSAYSADLTEGFVGDCILKLQDEFPECIIDGEMEEYTEQKPRGIREPPASKTRYTITIDWSEPAAPAAAAAAGDSDQSELEILRAKIAELESENARLKGASMCSPAADLLDIFTSFGAIAESKTL